MPKQELQNRAEDIGRFLDIFRERVLEGSFRQGNFHDLSEYVLMELLNNAQEHGNGFDESKKVTVSWGVGPDRLVISVKDEGTGFVPYIPEKPPRPEKPRGRGLWSVKQEASRIKFNRRGNRVTVLLEVDRNGK